MSARPRTLTIEEALSWAFLDELPLREAAPPPPRRPVASAPRRYTAETTVGLIAEMGENRFGVLRAVGVRGTAHPDAVLIGEAVGELDKLVIDVPPDWHPLPELTGLDAEVDSLIAGAMVDVRGRAARGAKHLGSSTSALVRRHALARTAPEWRVAVPEVRFRCHPNGAPMWFVRRTNWTKSVDGRDVAEEVEENGFNSRAKRPYGDAYRKPYLRPYALEIVEARATWERWHASLSFLADDLADRLTSVALLPFDLPARPWTEPEPPPLAPSLDDLADLL